MHTIAQGKAALPQCNRRVSRRTTSAENRRHGTHLENRIYESIYKKLTGRLKAGREAEDKMRRQKIGKTSEELFRKDNKSKN